MTRRVTVRYFAAYREALGVAEEVVETSATDVQGLFDELTERHHELVRYPAMRLAVNDEMANWKTPLVDGDTLLLFPPVAGG